jgi:hypothetical protein
VVVDLSDDGVAALEQAAAMIAVAKTAIRLSGGVRLELRSGSR